MSAKVRKIIGILDKLRVKYLFSAALILLFAQLVFGASAPRSMFAAAAPDSTRTHDSVPAYTLPEAAAEVPEAARTRSERRAQARAAREKARRHAEFEAMSQEERDSMFSSQVDSLIARRADSLAGR